MLESCFQRLFGVIRQVEFTFQQICGGTVCNLRFYMLFYTSSAMLRERERERLECRVYKRIRLTTDQGCLI